MKTTYCIIETPNFDGKKCAPAQIIKEFATRKAGENSDFCKSYSDVLTKKQAEKIIKKWNCEFYNGDYEYK